MQVSRTVAAVDARLFLTNQVAHDVQNAQKFSLLHVQPLTPLMKSKVNARVNVQASRVQVIISIEFCAESRGTWS